MKRCPSCKRTYSDETISFCLADGALLSPSYDPSREQGPPTEILPEPTRPVVPPTQASKTAIPTITSFPVAHDFAAPGGRGAEPVRKSRPLFWIASAFVAVAIVAGLVLALRYSLGSRQESVTDSNSQEALSGVNNSPSPRASPNFTTTNNPTETVPPTRSSPPDAKKANTMEADPVLIPKPATSREVAAPTASPSVDYSRIFSGKEVNSKARVLEKPEATYTAIARRNQIAGTVVLRAVFSSAGTVTNIRVVSSLPDGLTEQAIEAAKKIRFVPATKDGHPVSMYMELRYNFNLY